MSRPAAVLISDVHYNLNTLEIADKAMRLAIDKANELQLPLIVAGDLHDTKANMRAECVDAMLETFSLSKRRETIILRGNHDAYNEKSKEHALSFLDRFATIIDKPTPYTVDNLTGEYLCCYLIPYQHDINILKSYLTTIPKGSIFIMHQGLINSNSGHYIQGKSALSKQDVAGMRIISGHYHTRQTIDLPNGGKWDYIGNPFTLGFGEANDPPKGFQILMDDGSLKFIPTNLREHVILDYTASQLKGEAIFLGEDQDLIWVKIRGTKEELMSITKTQVAIDLDIAQSFKLDLISNDVKSTDTRLNLTQGPLLDSLIDSLFNTSDDRKTRLKELWKSLC